MIDGRRRRSATSGDDQSRADAPSWLSLHLSRCGAWLVRHHVTADQVTLAGVAFAAGTGVAIGFGAFYLSIVLLIVGGLMDTLDGVVAKAALTTSPRGAFVDSVADRLSDALIFGGVAWYLLDGRDPREAIVPIAILAVSGIVSYTRAKAESLGLSANGGLMERAERLILLGLALLLHVILVPLLMVLLILTGVTAIGRFIRVWRMASDETLRPTHRSTMELRWRTWRVQSSLSTAHRRSRRRSRELQPLGTRLRGVLRSADSGSARPERGAQRRERSSRALLRRIESDH